MSASEKIAQPRGGNRNNAASTKSTRTRAVVTRCASEDSAIVAIGGDGERKTRSAHRRAGRLRFPELLAGTTEAPLAGAIGCDRIIERARVEIRPKQVGE